MHILQAIFGAVGIITAVSTLIIAVHEAGHLLVGRLIGLRWKAFGIGVLWVSRDSGRWRFSMSRHWQGGLVSFMTPGKYVTRLQWAAVFLGGATANLIFGIALLVFIIRQSPEQQENSNGLGWLGGIACLSLFTAVVNLFPFRLKYRGLASDGLLLWSLLRQGPEFQTYHAQWDRANALTALYAAVKQGRRPKVWETGLVASATMLRDSTDAEATAAHYAFYWAVDCGDWLESDRHIGRALELLDKLTDAMRVQVLLDAAYHRAIHYHDDGEARDLIARATEIPQQDDEDKNLRRAMTLRAEAAALLAEGYPCEAEQTAQEAQSALSASAVNNIADQSLMEHLMLYCSNPVSHGYLPASVDE